MVQRVVYNSCFGGFGLKQEAVEWVRENSARLKKEYEDDSVDELAEQTIEGEMFEDGGGLKNATYVHRGLSRDNELLADIVTRETDYNGPINATHSSLSVAEVPDGIEWTIDEKDGSERVEETHRTFR